MEGVMMRGRTSAAVAIRKPDQSIYLYEEALNPRLYQNRLFHLPFVRGLLLLWEMLVLGTRLTTLSANIASGAEEPASPPPQAAPNSPDQQSSTGVGGVDTVPAAPTQVAAPAKIEGASLTITVLIALTFAVAIFFVVPLLITSLLHQQIGEGWLNLTV